MKALPTDKQTPNAVLAQLEAMRGNDADWRHGRTFSLVFDPGEEGRQLLKDAHNLYASENALNPSAFPSLRQMEQDCVGMTASLLHGDENVAGNLTSGGTESILLAMKTARDYAASERGITAPEVVLPITAHPAFDKAGKYFGIKMVYTPVNDGFRADVAQMRSAITSNTIALVGSAVQYAQGVVDPITEIGALAQKHDLLCHVDACIGGFMLPWVEKLGYPVPLWDFRVAGVTSISCDLHKYAYAAKGASTVLYRNKALRRHQFHVYTEWPGGIYASPTAAGTRPGGVMAAAWAIMNHLGEAGYLEIAKRVMETTKIFANGIKAIDSLYILGEPEMSILVFSSKTLNIFEIADELQARGWYLDKHQNPNCLHLTVSQGHCGIEQEFLDDLKAAVAAVEKAKFRQMGQDAKLKLVTGLANALPDKVFGKISRAANRLGSDGVPKRSAALYGMMAKLPARGELHELVLDAMDKLNSPPSDK